MYIKFDFEFQFRIKPDSFNEILNLETKEKPYLLGRIVLSLFL